MLIELKGLVKRFGSVTAVRGIDLKVQEGEFLTLLGPSGCGKTTLLRLIAGFIEPSEGEILLGNELITALPANRRPVGIVFQNYALFPHMTVEDNVCFGMRMKGEPRSVRQQKATALLELVGMQDFRSRYPGQISGGQQQRVALARTLAIEPRVLLLDEPLAALDRKLRQEMQVELKKLVNRIGITTICVTHDQDEALSMSDKIALMNHGEIVQYGSPMELYDHPRCSFVAAFVGSSNLLSGTLRSASGALTFESGALRLPLAGSLGRREGPATLLLRPECLELCAEPAGGMSLPGTITFVTHLGGFTQYEILLESGHELKVEMPRSPQQKGFLRGARVFVGLVDDFAYHLLQDTQSRTGVERPQPVMPS